MAVAAAGAKRDGVGGFESSRDSASGHAAGDPGVDGPAEHQPGQGTEAAAAERQGQVVDGLPDVQDGTERLLRKILYRRKFGFKATLAERKRGDLEETFPVLLLSCSNAGPDETEQTHK